jgi:PAS domain S-box-containing protein
LLLAIAVTACYAGIGPGIVTVVLSGLAFDYFFTEPLHTLYITSSDLPYWIIFIVFASLFTWFSAVRRRVERDLLQSHDELEKEVAVRTQQASLLDLTRDTIFVRDMSDIITYWNRGAQELYGWTAEQAIGKHAHQLLRTVFPVSLEEIQTELLSTSRWEGELEKTKADGTPLVKFTRTRSQPEIEIGATEKRKDGVVVFIKDNGVG